MNDKGSTLRGHDAEGGIRTHKGQPPMVFETIAYTVPPLRHRQEASIIESGLPVKFVRAGTSGVVMALSAPRLTRLLQVFSRWNRPADLPSVAAGFMLALMPAWSLSVRRGFLRVVPFAALGGGPSSRPPLRRGEYDEAALLAAAQRGHLPSFNQIILHYQGMAYNIAYRIVGDADSAADATQDAFVKAFQRIDQYRGGSFKAWLLRIVTNTCYDALRARKRRPTTSLESEEDDDDPEYDVRLVDHAERPESYVIRQELAGVIQTAIQQLPADQRATLVLADIEGLDYQKIADAMGAALGTVKSRLSRARAKLRDLLLAQEELLPPQYRLSGSR